MPDLVFDFEYLHFEYDMSMQRLGFPTWASSICGLLMSVINFEKLSTIIT